MRSLWMVCILAGTLHGGNLSYVPLPGNGTAQLIRTANAAGDVFVVSYGQTDSGRGVITATKLDASGRVLAAATVGDSATNYGLPTAAVVDPAGNLIIVSATNGATVAKLDPQLAKTVFLRHLNGTSGYTSGNAVAVDSVGNIYVSGGTASADFPVTSAAYQTTPPKGDSFGTPVYAFITKLSPDGSQILASTYFGTDAVHCTGGSACIGAYGKTIASAIAVDDQGQVWIAGSTIAYGLPTTPGAYATDCSCSHTLNALFISAFDANLAKLAASTFIPYGDDVPPYGVASVHDLAISPEGHPLIAGYGNPGLPTTSGTFQPTGVYPGSGYIAKLDRTLSTIVFGTYIGQATGGVEGVAVLPDSSLWITGTATPQGYGSSYVAHLAADASQMITMQTAPAGAAGQSLSLAPDGAPVALGTTGSVLRLPLESAAPILLGVANAAASQVSGSIAPLEVISLYGPGIGPDGQVTFDDTPGQTLYAGANQFNVIVPESVRYHDTVRIRITAASQVLEGPLMSVLSVEPGVFAGVVNQDGSVNSPDNPEAPGSIVSIWVTGADMSNIAVMNGDQLSLEVLYAGDAPGLAKGIGQVNFRLPASLPFTGEPWTGFTLRSRGAASFFIVYVTR
jgi:uncharacterized protein (TIGR03437 family)